MSWNALMQILHELCLMAKKFDNQGFVYTSSPSSHNGVPRQLSVESVQFEDRVIFYWNLGFFSQKATMCDFHDFGLT